MSNRVIRITNVNQLLKYWPFFSEGVVELRKKAWCEYDECTILKTMLALVEMGNNAWVGIVTSKNDKPLAFVAGYDNTPIFWNIKSFLVYITYSNSKDPKALFDLLESFEIFAKGQGIKHLQASTRRCSGAAIRCFKKYGLKQDFLFFRKEL